MRYKNYELRKTEDHKWEIVQWFPNNLVESCNDSQMGRAKWLFEN